MSSRKHLDTDRCPKPRELEAYAAKRLIGSRNERIFHHLKYCGKCLRALARLTQVPAPDEIVRGAKGASFWERLRARFSHR